MKIPHARLPYKSLDDLPLFAWAITRNEKINCNVTALHPSVATSYLKRRYGYQLHLAAAIAELAGFNPYGEV